MRTYQLAFLGLLLSFAQSAQAEEFRLNDIYTNKCERAQYEINLLNTEQAKVATSCSAEGKYLSSNGKYYKFVMTTKVTIPTALQVGMQIKMGDIYTNDPNCEFAFKEVMILNTKRFTVTPLCSSPGSYTAPSGDKFVHVMTTTITVNK